MVIASQLCELVERKNELNSKSPQIPKWAYKRAKKGIDEGQPDFKVYRRAEPNRLPASTPEQSPAPRLHLAKRFPRKPEVNQGGNFQSDLRVYRAQ